MLWVRLIYCLRRIAVISLTEIFKDILPEYRVGQIDTKMQTGGFV